jgi:hypothetical protein
VLPILETSLGRGGQAARRQLVDNRALDRWRAGGCPGGTLTLHRYRLHRHEVEVCAGADPDARILSLDHRPVGQVAVRRARRGLLGAVDALGAHRASRLDAPSGISLGEDDLRLRLVGGLTAGHGPRRLRATIGERTWTIAERTGLPYTVGVWRGGPDEAPVTWARPRVEVGWVAGATVAEVLLLEALALRFSPAELEVMLRRLASLGVERYSILTPIVRDAGL